MFAHLFLLLSFEAFPDVPATPPFLVRSCSEQKEVIFFPGLHVLQHLPGNRQLLAKLVRALLRQQALVALLDIVPLGLLLNLQQVV